MWSKTMIKNENNQNGKSRFNFFKKLPITSRVTIWYTSFIAVLLIFTIVFSMKITSILIEESEQNELVKEVTEKAFKKRKIENFKSFDDGIYFSLIKNGKILAGAYPNDFQANEISNQKAKTVTINNQKFMYYDVKYQFSDDNETWIRGVFPVMKTVSDLERLTWILVLISPLLLGIISFGGYNITKKAFYPVKKLSETANEIKINKDFSSRLYVPDVKDEIYDMSVVLNDMLDSLEQTYKKEKQFSNDVSHELRTPTSVILSESEYGIKYSDSLEEAKESFNVIYRQSLRMSNMIKNILEFSRIENLNEIQKDFINISDIMQKMMEDYEMLCSEKAITLSYNIQNNIKVSANQVLFERLIDNLMSNAIKFTKNKIDVYLVQNENSVEISIQDNGYGIEKSKIQNIWQRFYQVSESRNKNENSGIGLGLSFVDKIVKIHNWKINVESTVNEGSKFILNIF